MNLCHFCCIWLFCNFLHIVGFTTILFQYLHVYYVLSKEVKGVTRKEASGPIYSVCNHEGHSRNRSIAIRDKTYACAPLNMQYLCHLKLYVFMSQIYLLNHILEYKSRFLRTKLPVFEKVFPIQ